MKLSKRGFFMSLALGAAVAVAIACGSDEKDETKSGAQATGAATQAAAQSYTPAPKDQQTLTLPYAEPNFLDPHKSQFSQDIGVERMLFRGLFHADEKGSPQPAVAKELPTQQNGGISADGKTLKVTLKDNQKWSDGSPLTAKDFEYSFKRAFNPKLASPYASFAFNIAGSEEYYSALGTEKAPKNPSQAELNALRDAVGVKALDDKTLEIKLKEPQGTILIILGLWNLYPVKQSVVEAGGAGPESTAWTAPGKLVGNGAFVLKDRKEKDRIVVEANPNYTLEPKPKLNRVDIRIVEDEETAFNAFRTSEIDQVAIPPSKVPLVDGDPNLKKLNLRGPVPRTGGLEFNVTAKPLDNKNVRLALAKAIDRDTFVKVVRAGVAEATQCWLAPGTPGYDKADCEAIKFDPAAAKKALADAGFPNGQGFPELSFLFTSSPLNQTIAEFIQKQLKDNLNITIKLEAVDSKTRTSRYSNSQFELVYGGWQEDYHDPENWLPELWGTGGGNNQYKYSNPKFDDLMKQAKFEQNNEKRISLYKQAHKLLIDDANGGWLDNRIRNELIQNKVKNVTGNGQDAGWIGQFNIEQVEIAKQ